VEDTARGDRYKDCAGFPAAEDDEEKEEESELPESLEPFLTRTSLAGSSRPEENAAGSWRRAWLLRLRQLMRRLRPLLERLAGGKRNEDQVGKAQMRYFFWLTYELKLDKKSRVPTS